MQHGNAAPLLDVVVPVHGGWHFVRQCLESLRTQTIPVHVIVVDDLSPDDTLTRIRNEFSDATVLANATNKGFSASCNRGIAAGSAPYVLLLNSDVVARPDLSERLIESFEHAGAHVGSIAPLLLAQNGTIDSFGITADVTGAGYVRFAGADMGDADDRHPAVLGPYGAAAGYRRSALADVGVLDENIFMYGEELELAFRLRAGRWETRAVPFVAGTHIGGASAGKASSRQLYLSSFGRGYFLRVYAVLRHRHALRALVAEGAVVLTWALIRRDAAAWRGRLDGWRAGRGVARRPLVKDAPDHSIGFFRGLRMRRPGYWARAS